MRGRWPWIRLLWLNSAPTEQAYARTDLFDRRRGLMQEWADYTNGQEGNKNDSRGTQEKDGQ